MMSDGERLNWIRLARTHGIGPVSFFQLLRRFGSAGAANCRSGLAGPGPSNHHRQSRSSRN